MTTEDGATDFDISFKVARGIDPAEYADIAALEAHIREHYDDWREIAEVVWM